MLKCTLYCSYLVYTEMILFHSSAYKNSWCYSLANNLRCTTIRLHHNLLKNRKECRKKYRKEYKEECRFHTPHTPEPSHKANCKAMFHKKGRNPEPP